MHQLHSPNIATAQCHTLLHCFLVLLMNSRLLNMLVIKVIVCVCVCQLDRVIFCVFLPADKELYLQNLPLYFPAGELSHKHAYSCIHTQTHTLTHKHSPIYSDDSSAQLNLATYTNRDTHNGVINTLDHPLCAICTSSAFTHTHDHQTHRTLHMQHT